MNRLVCACIAVAAVGCSSDPVDVSGAYTISVTDEANGCNLMNFNQGDSSSNIPAAVTQTGSTTAVKITGLVGAYLTAVLGSAEFQGTVDGSSISATLFGTRSSTSGGCAYTYDALLEGDLAGDALTGTITYTPKTNGSPDCSSIEGCKSVQNFNGTRPPM